MSKVGRPKSVVEKVQVTFQVPVYVHRRLLSYCEENGTTQTWVLWQALEHFLDKKDNG